MYKELLDAALVMFAVIAVLATLIGVIGCIYLLFQIFSYFIEWVYEDILEREVNDENI